MSNRILILLGILVIGGLGYLGYTFLEYYEETEDLGWGDEANRNPYLAAMLYAEELDINTKSVDSYLSIDHIDDIDTIFLTHSTQVVGEKRITELLRWVNEGGHLIVGASSGDGDQNGRLFEILQVTTYDTDYSYQNFSDIEDIFENLDATDPDISNEPAEGTADAKDQKASELLEEFNKKLQEQQAAKTELTEEQERAAYESKIDTDAISSLSFIDTEGEVRVHFTSGIGLRHPQFYEDADETSEFKLGYWEGDDYGVHFMQIEHGTGLVSVLSDSELFLSDEIQYFDHAYLWQILADKSEQLVLVVGSNMPSLWAMLKKLMPEALLAGMVWLLAWLWFNMSRFGSIVQRAHTIRRSFAEHIEASAAYLWRGAKQKELLDPVRDDILQRAEKRLPEFANASIQQRFIILSKLSDQDPAAVTFAFKTPQLLNEDAFTQVVRVLQKIRKSL